MKKIILGVLAIICLVVGVRYLWKSDAPLGVDVVYSGPTMATSSVGIYSSSLVLGADSGRQFVSFCNYGASGDSLYLGFGATSTKPYGRVISSQACYQMTLENMFTGPIYSIASTATSTLLIIYK